MSSFTMPRRLLLPVLGLALSLGCGDSEDNGNGGPIANGAADAGSAGPDLDGDGWLDEEDNCPTVVNFEQRDRDNDGIGDQCDSCPATPNAEAEESGDPCLPVDEQEPNDSSPQPLELLPAGQFREVRGFVETPRANNQAFDRFQIDVDAGELYRIRVARADADSSLQPAFEVTGPDFAPRQAEDRFIATRELYFPRAGTYEVAVADRRGLFGDTPRGGDDESYALSIERLDVETRSVEIGTDGFRNRTFTFDDPNSITLLESTITEASRFTFVTTRTDLGRSESNIGLDTIIVVELPDQVLENDDVGPGVTDSQLTIQDIPADTPVRIVLDHARRVGPFDTDYEIDLTVRQEDRFPELEPNDTIDTASPLQFPNCRSDIPTERREQVDGLIETRPFTADADFFEFTPAAGDIVRFDLGQGAGGNFSPALQVLELRGGTPVPIYSAEGETGAIIPMIFPESRPYYLQVNHGPNLDPDADPAGGPLFDYRVFMQCLATLNREPFVSSSARAREVTQVDGISRYALVPQGETVIADVLITDARLGTEVGAGAQMTPELQLLGEDAVGRLAAARGGIGFGRVAGLLQPEDVESSSVLAVFNPNGFRAFNYRLAVDFEPVTPVDEEAREPNNQIANATPVSDLPAAIGGVVAPSDPDFIRFNGNGSAVDVFANAGGDTVGLSISDTAGNVIESRPNAVLGFSPPPGDYVIRVTSNVETPYTLIITDRPDDP